MLTPPQVTIQNEALWESYKQVDKMFNGKKHILNLRQSKDWAGNFIWEMSNLNYDIYLKQTNWPATSINRGSNKKNGKVYE